ncbi:hypothetical protein [Roseicyclus sp.]|uniref:hypothetical protein n=1 Tax=Roseicyclus sp. TaxID=1914329 RepID=UPI003F9ED4CC
MKEDFISAAMSMEGPACAGPRGAESSVFSGGSGVSVTDSAPAFGRFYILLEDSIGTRDMVCNGRARPRLAAGRIE